MESSLNWIHNDEYRDGEERHIFIKGLLEGKKVALANIYFHIFYICRSSQFSRKILVGVCSRFVNFGGVILMLCPELDTSKHCSHISLATLKVIRKCLY